MDDDVQITVEVSEETRQAFKMACLVLGYTMSEVLRGCIHTTILDGQRRQEEMGPSSVWTSTGKSQMRFDDTQGQGEE